MLQRTQMKEKNMLGHKKVTQKSCDKRVIKTGETRLAQGEEMREQMLDKDEAIKS